MKRVTPAAKGSAPRLGLLLLCMAACDGGDPPPVEPTANVAEAAPWFEEVAAESGLDFVHDSGHRDRYFIPEIVSAGAALFDMDNDGDLDIYLVQSGEIQAAAAKRPPNRLFRNRGDGNFDDVTEASGAGDRGYGMGVATGDFDNDGRIDLYVTNLGANALLRNVGDGRFTEVTAEAGVAGGTWSSSAAFLDYDGDGWLDLFVVNYIHWSPDVEIECYVAAGRSRLDYCGPVAYRAPARDTLYRNLGDGTFRDVSKAAGLASTSGNGLGVVTGDFDGDFRQDIFVANDGLPNQLWLNQGNGTLSDHALLRGVAVAENGKVKAGMGVASEDIDDDGDLDILVVNMKGENDTLFVNEGAFFVDGTARFGLTKITPGFTRFGLGFVDFDNDGRLDIYEANGRIRWHSQLWADDIYAEPNIVMRGTADGRFTELEPRGGTRELLVATSRAAAFGDIDGDGRVDVLVANRDGPVHLLHNVAPAGHWLELRVFDTHGRDALGARVTLRVGSRRLRRDVRTASSYCAANDPRVHIGLGAETDVTDIEVRWPDGRHEAFSPAETLDREVTLRQGEGTALARH